MTAAPYDIAIIGAGPAGTVLAKELGIGAPELKILLVDNKRKKVCGGLLSPDAQKALAIFGLTLPNSVLADPQIFDVETIDISAHCIRNYQRHYLNMDRAKFDAWLLSLVPQNVTVVGGSCTEIIKDNKLYKLTVCSRDSKTEYISSSVIGADGASSIVRRSICDKPIYHYISIQQHFENKISTLPAYACIFDKSTSDSCSWIINKDGETIFGGAFKIKGGRSAFDKQKKNVESFIGNSLGNPKYTEACLLTQPRRFRDVVTGKNEIYLIGEAAGFISASSFEGISYAMISAKLLAESFIKGKSNKEIQKIYKRKTLRLRLKVLTKIIKGKILCSTILRRLIMKSGIKSIKKYIK